MSIMKFNYGKYYQGGKIMSQLLIKKIKKDTIFQDDFLDMKSNNIIEFSTNKIAIVYGPNGVGKTSLASVLNKDEGTEFDGEFDGSPALVGKDGIFHIIADQNGRNIIEGKTEDFLLGDNIRKEHDLKDRIDNEFSDICQKLNDALKSNFNISKKTSNLAKKMTDEVLNGFVTNLANSRSKGKEIDLNKFVEKISQLEKIQVPAYDSNKLAFLINDFENSKSLINQVLLVPDSMINQNEHFQEINEDDEAISILSKYSYKNECIVCDNDIDPVELLKKKTDNRQHIFDSLDDNTKKIFENIIKLVPDNDPFQISSTFSEAIKTGKKDSVYSLKDEIKTYFSVLNILINNLFFSCLKSTSLEADLKVYNDMIKQKLEITEDDVLYIEDIINDNINKKIQLKRDHATHDIKLLLGNDEFLNKGRSDLHLSTGEQNFISLCFEFLKAKNCSKPIIVIDDPISSFDSIYKNKIAYAIIKFLYDKKQIILTHNLDLVRLLECQYKGCFTLYLFNNVQDELNGFIKISDKEKNILLYIDKLLNLFRTDIFSEIANEKNFLIAMIPFMRGYAQLINDVESKNNLTLLMHGYKHDNVNVSNIYKTLFNNDAPIIKDYTISVVDILSVDIDNLQILKVNNYPLLNRTLKHSLVYLYLRLSVEKVLVEAYPAETRDCDLLGQIIDKALRGSCNQEHRIYLTSRKTLLNEFNHFEGNMNIFQPAIDISDSSLKAEKVGILKELNDIKVEKRMA